MTTNFLEIIQEIESKPKGFSLGGHEDLSPSFFESFEKMPRHEVEDQSTLTAPHG